MLAGDRAGEDRSPTWAYWKLYWSTINPDLRLSNLLHANKMQTQFYLPHYVDYYDYDFRNAQALRLFEDLVWESVYSGYTHQDYLNIYNKYRETYDSRSLKWDYTNLLRLNIDRDFNQTFRFGTNAKSKNLANIGKFYTNSIQLDDYFLPVNLLAKKDLSEFSVVSESTTFDDSYLDQKNLLNLFYAKKSLALGLGTLYNNPQSSHSVLNNFRADFEDFSHFQNTSKNNLAKLPQLKSLSETNLDNPIKVKYLTKSFNQYSSLSNAQPVTSTEAVNLDVNPSQTNWARFSNPLALRRSAKGSIVTYQAFQKVFKLRYDEGRAHVRLTDFANSRSTQPYTTEQRIKYERMIGKTKIKHYNTNYNVSRLLPVFNPLAGLNNSLNYYFYEFPFLDGVTNDPTRHVWFDGFIKYAQREVSGSSVSKYSIVGVPFFKKKYDFNVKQGKQMADSELYFARIATARKNYLPNWIYTPYLYSKSKVWYVESRLKLLYKNKIKTSYDLNNNLLRMEWYWSDSFFSKTTSSQYTPSFSNSSNTKVFDGPSIRNHQITKSCFRTCSVRRPRS